MDRAEMHLRPIGSTPDRSAGSGSILAVDADDGMAVVHQVMRQGEARRPSPPPPAPYSRSCRIGVAQVQRVPAGQQAVDLETPGSSSTSLSVRVSCGISTGSCFW